MRTSSCAYHESYKKQGDFPTYAGKVASSAQK